MGRYQSQQQPSVPRDHQFLVCRNDPRRCLAGPCRYAWSPGEIGFRICFDTQPRTGGADSRAYFRGVLPNARREYQTVDTAQYRGQRPDLPGSPVHKVVHGQTRSRLAASKKIAHVTADAGNPEQPGLSIEDGLNLFSRKPQRLKQIKNDARDPVLLAGCPCRRRRVR